MATFAEGIESLKLACSLVLLIPALGIALFGRRRSLLVPVWIAVVAVVSWTRFVGWWPFDSSGFWHVIAGMILVGVVALAWRRDDAPSDLAATALAATIAAWTWVPCVGEHLGEILNNARRNPWEELLPTFAYIVGLFVPLVVIAAFAGAWPAAADRMDHRYVRATGLGIVFVVGALVSVTLFDDLAGELARRSSF